MSARPNPQSTERLLWVDDDPHILESIKRTLRSSRREIVTATTVDQALEYLRTDSFDVVAADHQMGIRNGLEVLEMARDLVPRTTRILVTGEADTDLARAAINRAGVFRFVLKPWDSGELEIDVRAAIERKRELVRQQDLVREISQKNQTLEGLRFGLETLVSERTRKIFESKNEIELQQKRLRGLVKFIEELGRLDNFHELLAAVRRDLRSLYGPCDIFLVCEQTSGDTQLLFLNAQEPQVALIKKSDLRPFHDQNEMECRHILADLVARPIGKLSSHSVSFTGRHAVTSTKSQVGLMLLVEHHHPEANAGRLQKIIAGRWPTIEVALERIWLRQKLRDAAVEWERTFDGIQDPIAIVDSSLKVLRSNGAFKRFISKKTCYETFAGTSHSCLGCPVSDNRSRELGRPGSIRVGAKFFDVYSYPIDLVSGLSYSTFVNHYVDVTEHRELYGQMIQSEKMAAMGLLAGNIAHELNNPLTGIRAMSQLLARDERVQSLQQSSRVQQDLAEVELAAARCQAIISNLLAFTKPEKEVSTKFDLRQAVERSMGLLKTAMRDHNRELELGENPIWVRGDPQLLQQVIFNLVNNACQAMKQPGTISVSLAADADFAEIKVRDSGPGIATEIADKIFEPFFTTKPEGEGTGLGLSMSRTIVENMGGRLTVSNHPEGGAEFRLVLPTVSEKS